MTLGLEMVDPQLKCKLGMCLGIARIKDGTDKAGCDTTNKIYEERVGFKCKVITYATTSSRATKDAAKMFNQDEDFCDMLYCDKVSKSAVGCLFRKKNKVKNFLTFAMFKLHINSNPQIIFLFARC